MRNDMEVIRHSGRANNAVIHFVSRFFCYRSIHLLLPSGLILRMNALPPIFPGRNSFVWIETEDSISFLGEVYGGLSGGLPTKASPLRKPLPFQQITLAASQCFMCSLSLGNVRYRSQKLRRTCFVLYSMGYKTEMLNRSVRQK